MTEPSSAASATPTPARAIDRPPWQTWVIGLVVLVVNLLRLVDAVFSLTGNAWYFKQLGYTREQIGYFTELGWLPAVLWAVALFAGIAGALFLLAGQRLAAPVLLIATVAQAVLLVIGLAALNSWTALGPALVTRSVLLLLILGLATGYAWRLGQRGRLH